MRMGGGGGLARSDRVPTEETVYVARGVPPPPGGGGVDGGTQALPFCGRGAEKFVVKAGTRKGDSTPIRF
jgi:hypothetical protein